MCNVINVILAMWMMILFVTVILGLGCLVTGLLFHNKNKEKFNDVYISPLATSDESPHNLFDENTDGVAIAETRLIAEILRDEMISDDQRKMKLMTFTRINQRKEKQIPIVGLPDKSLFHVH